LGSSFTLSDSMYPPSGFICFNKFLMYSSIFSGFPPAINAGSTPPITIVCLFNFS